MKREKIDIHTMKMIVQTPHFTADKKLTDLVRRAVGKLAPLSDRIIEAQVCLRIGNTSTDENKFCELKIVIPGNDMFAARHGSTFEDTIYRSVEAVRHQIERWKGSGNDYQLSASIFPPEIEET
jgi:putative sigma-54 modulation protein